MSTRPVDRRDHPAVRNYAAVCLAALLVLFLVLVDRGLGAWSLLPVLAVFVASGVGFLAAVKEDWPRWTVYVLAGLAGACIPPVSSMIRVRWTHLLRGSSRLPTALAMESVVDEFVFIVGPVLVTFLSTTGHATSGVVTATITNDFSGYGPERIFVLDNGQVWQQAEAWYWYWYWFRPNALIYPASGGWKMHVENIDHDVLVRRLK